MGVLDGERINTIIVFLGLVIENSEVSVISKKYENRANFLLFKLNII
jgi:hypothetical protein